MTRPQQVVLTIGMLALAAGLHWYAVDWRVAQGPLGIFVVASKTQAALDAMRSAGLPTIPQVLLRVTDGAEPIVLLAGSGLDKTLAFFMGIIAPPVLVLVAYILELGGYAARKRQRLAAAGAPPEQIALSSKRAHVVNLVLIVVTVAVVAWVIHHIRQTVF